MKYISGQYYHIYNRSVEKRDIFTCDENYRFLLRRINEFLPNYPLTFIAYCLMPNHYHFLVRAETGNGVGPFLQRLFNSYTQAFNQQENRSGTLFEGHAKSVMIDSSSYLFHIVRYIHLNPVRAGLAPRPEDWPYSNYLEFIGLREGPLRELAFVQEQFGMPQEYRKFVEDAIPNEIQRRLEKYKLD